MGKPAIVITKSSIIVVLKRRSARPISRSIGLSIKPARGVRLKRKPTEPCTRSWSRNNHRNSSLQQPSNIAMSQPARRTNVCQRRQAELCAIVALLAILNGCGSADNRVLEEISEQVYSVEPGVNLSIQNREGAVLVYGSDTNEMRVRSVKKAYSRER